MIIRAWRARAAVATAHVYAEHFRRQVLPELRRIPGFLGAALLREAREDAVGYLVLSRWSSLDAIRAFAGAEVTRAVVAPEAAAALLDFDDAVSHYEVIEEMRA